MNKNNLKQSSKKMTAFLLCFVICLGMLSGCANSTAAVDKLIVSTTEAKISYEIGEEISYEGLKIQAKFNSDFYRDLNEDEYTISTNFDNTTSGDYTVSISYKQNNKIETNYKVSVNQTQAKSLAIKEPASKQIYEIGENIDYSGLVLEKTVSTSKAINIPLEDCFISSDFDSSKPGIYTVNLILKENSAIKTLYTVTVMEAHAERLEINTDNAAKTFSVGQDIDYSGLLVKQLMSDGINVLLETSEYSITTDYNKKLGGTYLVTITLNSDSSLFATYSVNVNSVATVLEVTTPATKLIYNRNEAISYNGLTVSKVFNDGIKVLLTESEYVLTTDYNKSLGGVYTVTIKLKDDESITTSYQVTVEKKLTSISVKTKPAKTTFQVGEAFDASGLIIQKAYNDNTKEELTADAFTIDPSNYNAEKGGSYRINVALKEDTTKKTYFDVKVEKLIVSCAHDGASSPKKTIYELNEDIDLLNDVMGLKLVLTYNDGTTADANRYAFKHTTDFIKGVAGTYNVTISFKLDTYPAYTPVQDFTYSYSVIVREPVERALRVSKYPTKTLYKNGEAFAIDGLKMEKVYSDGSARVIAESDYFVETAYDSSKAGVYIVKIMLSGNSEVFVEFSVTVNPDVSPITFVTALKDNAQILGSRYTFDFTAKDSTGTKISDVEAEIDGNASIRVNWSDDEKTSYTINLNNAAQDYKIIFTATDGSGNVVGREFNITHPPVHKGDVIGQITFSIEAFTIGHGYIVTPTVMNIYEGENSVFSLARLIRSNGYCFTYSGTISSGFYIQRIISGTPHNISGCACKELNTAIPIINPKNLLISINPPQNLIDEVGELDIESYEQGTLGEFDLNFMSGWMYAVNNVFPNVGFADCYPMDGDVIRAQFTLAFGSDIGGGWGGGYFEDVSRDQLTKLLSQVYQLTNEKKAMCAAEFNAALNAVAVFGITQLDLDIAYSALNDVYLKVVTS